MKKITRIATIPLFIVVFVSTLLLPMMQNGNNLISEVIAADISGRKNAAAQAAPAVCVSHRDAVIFIRSQMTKRVPVISLYYSSEKALSIEDVFSYEDSADNEGDYLRWSIKNYSWKEYDNNRIEIRLEYYTTYEQEQEIDLKVEEIGTLLKQTEGFESFSDYQKLILAYDWVCDNINYTREFDEDRESTMFDALVDDRHETQCRGFALAYYRIAHALSLDCRIVVGQIRFNGEEKNHMWNIVRVKRSWYHVDTTHGAWKDEEMSGKDRYLFFMMPLQFADAAFIPEYENETIEDNSCFRTPREIMEYTFDRLIVNSRNVPYYYFDPLSGIIYLGRYNLLTPSCSTIDSSESFRQYEKSIRTIIVTDRVQSIAAECFKGFSSADVIYLPESVEEIGGGAFDDCVPELVVHCIENSFTHTYLLENDIPFHLYEYTSPVPATCASMGYSKGLWCAECGNGFHGYDFVHVTDEHKNVSDGKCLDCGTIVDGIACGTYGDQSHWYLLESGELVICGKGGIPLPQFLNGHCPWKKYSSQITKLTIKPGIAYFGGKLFLDSVTEIDLPSTLQVIDRGAFSGSKLDAKDELYLREGLMWLGKDSFAYSKVKHVYVPKTLMHETDATIFPVLNGSAFTKSMVERITFAYGIPVIPEQICAQANRLETIDLPGTVLRIEKQVFQDCSALTSVELPTSLETIGASGFQNSGLKTVILPESLQAIGDFAFENCSDLTSVFIPGNTVEIGIDAFANCPSAVIHCNAGSSAAAYATENGIACHTKLIILPKTEPSCTKKGETEEIFCLNCGKVIEKSKELPRSEHKDVLSVDETPDGVCDICGNDIPPDNIVHETNRFSKRYEDFISSLVKILKLFLKIIQNLSN